MNPLTEIELDCIKRIPIRWAYCLNCELWFEWLPSHYHSTTITEIPECPYCEAYGVSVDHGLIDKHDRYQPKEGAA